MDPDPDLKSNGGKKKRNRRASGGGVRWLFGNTSMPDVQGPTLLENILSLHFHNKPATFHLSDGETGSGRTAG